MNNITKPEHYQSTIEPIDFIVANNLNFIEGNIIKYVARYKKKNGLEDLLKGFEYYKKLIESVENENNLQKMQNAITNKDDKLIKTQIVSVVYTYETSSEHGLLGSDWLLHRFKINKELGLYFLRKIEIKNGLFDKKEYVGQEFNKDTFKWLVKDLDDCPAYENVKFVNYFAKQDAGVYMFETDNETFILKPNEK